MGCLKLEILEKYDNLKITFRAKNSVFLGDLDYYPFGMQMPGRSFNSSSYRFGYNAGSEKDDEITGVTGSHFTTFFREFDTRIGRPWTPDPVFQPWQSPYNSMDNNPIWFNDPLGDRADGFTVDKDGNIEPAIDPKTGKQDKIGGDNNDVLYEKKEYQEGKRDNFVKVADTKLLPQLENVREGWESKVHLSPDEVILGYAGETNSRSSAMNVFLFAGKASKSEWSLEKHSNGWIVGTHGVNGEGQAPNLYTISDKYSIMTLLEDYHSHPGTSYRKDYIPSSTGTVGGDIGRRNILLKQNPNIKFYLYTPKLTKESWNAQRPNQKIDYEPSKIREYTNH